MNETQPSYTLDRVVRWLVSAGALVLVLALLRHLSDVLLPFAAAAVLAYLLNPLVTFIERKTNRRGLAVGVTIGGLFVAGLAIAAVVVPLMISQMGRFRGNVEKLRDDLVASIDTTVQVDVAASAPPVETAVGDVAPSTGSPLGWRELKEAWAQYRADRDLPRSERLARFRNALAGTYAGDFLDRAAAYTKSDEFNRLLLDAARGLAIGGWSVAAFAVNVVLGLTGLIVVLLYLVFLLLDYPEYVRTWPTFLPPRYRGSIVEFLEQFDVALRRYFRGQSLVALSVGTLFAVGFTLIGLPMALPFGLFVGLLNMVPYLQTVAIVPAVFLAGLRAIEGDASFLGSVALTLMIFAAVQLLQDAIISPRVMGQATGLRPVAILLGVFIWGKLLGFLGLLLAIPLTCLGIAYYRRYILLHESAGSLSSPPMK